MYFFMCFFLNFCLFVLIFFLYCIFVCFEFFCCIVFFFVIDIFSSPVPKARRRAYSISNRKAMNRNWSNQKTNPALKTKTGHK